jgi:hypothetical protein
MKQRYISYAKGTERAVPKNKKKLIPRLMEFAVRHQKPKKVYLIILGLSAVVVWQQYVNAGAPPRILVGNSDAEVILDPKKSETIAAATETNGFLSNWRLFYNTKSRENKIKNTFSSIEKVNIKINNLSRKVVVRLDLKTPTFILKDASGTEYFVGESGEFFAFDQSIYPEQSVQTIRSRPVITTQIKLSDIGSNDKIPSIFTGSDVLFLTGLAEEAKAQGLTLTTIEQGSNIGQITISLADASYKIKMHIDGDPRQQVVALVSIREKLAAEGKVPLEYIDVRAGERIYIK